MAINVGKFQKPVGGAAAKAGEPAKSRYAGIKANAPRPPMPHVGIYRFRCKGVEKGNNPGKSRDSYKIALEIAAVDESQGPNDMHKVGDLVYAVFLLNNTTGLGKAKSCTMAFAGFEDEDEYNVFDLNDSGLFMQTVLGDVSTSFGKAGQTITDRLVDAMVIRGNACDGGTDYYREYAWAVVPDEEQDALPRADLQPAHFAEAKAGA
jgi:hypothetical protein